MTLVLFVALQADIDCPPLQFNKKMLITSKRFDVQPKHICQLMQNRGQSLQQRHQISLRLHLAAESTSCIPVHSEGRKSPKTREDFEYTGNANGIFIDNQCRAIDC
jgi:hypothetical protein